MKTNNTIYEVGDLVFDISRGWSVVTRNDYDEDYPILLENNMMYTSDGKHLPSHQVSVLSFTEYTLEGFSQKRPKERLPFKVGDVVYLSDNANDRYNYNFWITTELQQIDRNDNFNCCFVAAWAGSYTLLALENPLLNPNTKIYTTDDL